MLFLSLTEAHSRWNFLGCPIYADRFAPLSICYSLWPSRTRIINTRLPFFKSFHTCKLSSLHTVITTLNYDSSVDLKLPKTKNRIAIVFFLGVYYHCNSHIKINKQMKMKDNSYYLYPPYFQWCQHLFSSKVKLILLFDFPSYYW